MIRNTIALCLALGLAHGRALAQDLAAVVQGVEATYGEVTSLQAGFVQVSRSTAMGETKQRGKVWLERPRKMRWAFTQPPGKLFVTDGSTMWVWSKADNQVIISLVVSPPGGDMTQLLDNLGKLDDLFIVELLETTGLGAKGSLVLGLTPKREGNLQRIELRVSKQDYTVEQVKTVDGFGNEVELNFHNVKTNVKIPGSRFSFDVPKGAQIIRTEGP